MKKKADCTPEEWAAHLEYIRQWRLKNIEEQRARKREYTKRPEVKAKRQAYDNRPETKERKAKWYRESGEAEKSKARDNKPEQKASKLASQRCRRTGFTEDLRQSLLVSQQGCCAVCGHEFQDPKQIRSDHCHATNTPRGLLCHPCNIIEGYLNRMDIEPEEFARRLVQYLANPPAQSTKLPLPLC